jgi:hypothetical protein
MYRGIATAIAVALIVACTDVRVGMERSPIGAVNSNEAMLQAIKHSLPSSEQTCQLELVSLDNAQGVSENAAEQVASVRICGRLRKFAIERNQVNADSVLIVAKKI